MRATNTHHRSGKNLARLNCHKILLSNVIVPIDRACRHNHVSGLRAKLRGTNMKSERRSVRFRERNLPHFLLATRCHQPPTSRSFAPAEGGEK
jgi:hypothetical protein